MKKTSHYDVLGLATLIGVVCLPALTSPAPRRSFLWPPPARFLTAWIKNQQGK